MYFGEILAGRAGPGRVAAGFGAPWLIESHSREGRERFNQRLEVEAGNGRWEMGGCSVGKVRGVITA